MALATVTLKINGDKASFQMILNREYDGKCLPIQTLL
jgi:hypothetical protein